MSGWNVGGGMAKFEEPFGTDPDVLVRRDDPDTSHAAAEAVDTTKLEHLVYNTIASFGEKGCISDEVRGRFPQYPYSSITARYKALLDKGLIVDTGLRRAGNSGRGQRVLQAKRRDPICKRCGEPHSRHIRGFYTRFCADEVSEFEW